MTDGPDERVAILFYVEASIFINTSVFHIFKTYILLDISDQECPSYSQRMLLYFLSADNHSK